MLTCSLDRLDDGYSDASVAMPDELGGWASVAEALLLDCARAALVDVAEPTARARVAADYAAGLTSLVHARLCDAAAQHRAAVQEERRSDALAGQLRIAAQEAEAQQVALTAERAARAAAEAEASRLAVELVSVREECEALRAERVAVWGAVREASAAAGLHSGAGASVEEHVRALGEWVRHAEAALSHEEVPALVTRPSYRRVLPAAPLNPVTASLLRVKAQVQQMREPSVMQLQEAVGARRAVREEPASPATPSPRVRATTAAAAAAASATTPTPLPVHRALGRSSSFTPRRTANGAGDAPRDDDLVASPPWRTHMAKLQAELQGLRRDLGTASAATP